MKSKKFKSTIVVLLTALALYYLVPPGGKNLIDVFSNAASVEGEQVQQLEAILKEARELESENNAENLSNVTFMNLSRSIGDVDIEEWFSPAIQIPSTESNATRYILSRLQKDAAGKLKLGLDLQGGMSFLVEVGPKRAGTNDQEMEDLAAVQQKNETDISRTIEVLRKRVDRFGVAEPVIQPVGSDKILIQLPGLTQSERDSVRTTLETAAVLEFRLVHPQSASWIAQDIVPPNYEKVPYVRTDENTGEEFTTYMIVSNKSEQGLTGKYVTSAYVAPSITGIPEIVLNFNGEGGKLFADVTMANVNNQLAIVLDGVVQSAPNIDEPITGGQATIRGDFTQKEAFDLVSVLENPLENPVKIIEERGVDPTLGKDSIKAGIQACLVGIILVLVFMLFYYMWAGVIAGAALTINLILLLGCMASIDATLTLPGIAGIVLTIGMAVDANVLIFERIREELLQGKSLKGSISQGFDKVFSTIFDANITTVIASVILINFGTGPVKGFGTTLTMGIAASMFTALILTRILLEFLREKGILTKLRMLRAVGKTTIPFLQPGIRKFTAIGSTGLIVAAIVFAMFVRKENTLGIDFTGGDSIMLSYSEDNRPEEEAIRVALEKVGVTESIIQYQSSTVGGGGEASLKLITKSAEVDITKSLQGEFPSANFETLQSDFVGPSVGVAITKAALISALIAIFAILFYVAIRFEFSFAIAAVIALVHDVAITLGIFLLLGGQINAPIIAALLTIFGFSINDTIVIFDRIREDLNLGIKGKFVDLMNRAVNQTLARTVITSGTTLLAAAALFVFGGPVIRDFALTFLIGIVVGTYSSIYIAGSSVLWITKGERPQTDVPPTFDPEVTAAESEAS